MPGIEINISNKNCPDCNPKGDEKGRMLHHSSLRYYYCAGCGKTFYVDDMTKLLTKSSDVLVDPNLLANNISKESVIIPDNIVA